MTTGGSPDVSCAAEFLRELDRVRHALLREYPELATLETALRGVRSGELARKARTADGFTYSVHGAGCLMTAPDGTEVDIDLLPGGLEAFDLWRLKTFAESRGTTPVPQAPVLLNECRELMRRGVLVEPREGWFSPVAGGRPRPR
ncbi:DUF6896 domain-containing protein [Streptomyces sp. NPDC001777]|uniref:DUF6896 domain-containing protein n=1 Tax=Streptomyces sp. NPDC001777 TaxID=3364608 RepID=UPI00368E7750